ncbi:MAG: MBL fold metallo-hydrolase [Armatimonadota bacterium]
MIFETIETPGLAHLSYLVGDETEGVCAVIDPRRDVEIYLELAQHHHARITHVLETHVHADFVSGARELAARTGALAWLPAGGGYQFDHSPLAEGDVLELDSLCLQVLHTPGHTPEHVSLVISGGKGAKEPWGVFTGDTLFAGEVGRPDLLGEAAEEDLARQLFHSLHEKLLRLPDGLEIYPAHGEGSPCGGSIGDRRTSTIGYERRHNEKLRLRGVRQFTSAVLESLPPAPFYYPRMKRVNAAGPPVLGCLPALQPLSPERFEAAREVPGTLVVDTREIEAFGGAHIPGALNIALREEFPIWAGWMLPPEAPLLLVLEDESDLETAQRQLLRVGLENVVGYLRQGMRGWLEAGHPFDPLPQMSVHELHERVRSRSGGLQVLDVRRDDEWEQGHVPTATHVFAPHLPERMHELDLERPVAVYCGSGYRASIAASLLQQRGFREVYSVPGSIKAWKAAGYALR